MNGGQNNLPGSLNGDQFSLVPTNGVLSPEEYYRVQRQLDEVKQRIQVVEQNNKAALENYLAQRAQEGREAELMLAQLQAARNPQVAPASTIPASTSATASPDPGYGGNFTGIPSAAPMRPAAANGEARRSQQSSSAFASSAQPSVFHNQAVPPQPQQSHIPDVWRASVMQTATTGQMPPQSSTSQYAAVSHQASGLAQPPSQHYRRKR
ncbi:hypothetical protein CERSUDRAFT_91088 [Gelatoporia subvermispora B]|uniref:Uncharacterized protein n=1 Tax=Ceriporiopsis subvermispora (strain B) TaxID=914234 RepID=M2R7G1_CERS8|nr:hypothetical protein CERSUDRAFT_91088 [Gelatoporia subvermispora B]